MLSESGVTACLKVASFGVNAIAASEEDEQMIKDLQKAAVMRDPNMAAANLAASQADAMRTAAANENGAMMGFMGMGMANAVGGMNPQGLYGQGGSAPQSQYPVAAGGGFAAPTPEPAATAAPAAAPAAGGDAWTCSCGASNTGKFCSNCGSPKPEPSAPAGEWTCSCGAKNTGKFCRSCVADPQATAAGIASAASTTPAHSAATAARSALKAACARDARRGSVPSVARS